MNTEFKVGDKVRAVASWDGVTPPGVGTVVKIFAGLIEVDFPGWSSGHAGSGGEPGSGNSRWYYGREGEALQLVEESPRLSPESAGFSGEAIVVGNAIHEAIGGEILTIQESDDDMRDRIAAKLMPGLVARLYSPTADECASQAFIYADAYMAERAKRRAGA